MITNEMTANLLPHQQQEKQMAALTAMGNW